MVEILRRPITGAAAWKGSELADSNSWTYCLTPEEIQDIENALKVFKDKQMAWWKMNKDDFPLPVLGPTLLKIRDELENGRGFLRMRGLPVEKHTVKEIETLYFGLSTHMGQMISQNPKGDLIDHICDKGKSYEDINVKGYETTAQLTPHCDSGDLVGLLCVRKAKSGGENTISSFASVYNEILSHYPEFLDVLYRGFHQNIRGGGPPGKGENVTLHRVPVYTYYKGRLSGRFNAKAMRTGAEWPGIEPLTDHEKAAIDCVETLALRPDLALRMVLEPGDLQFLNNHNLLHTRNEFEDHPEPHLKRLLMRIWINIPNGRELPDNFADHYNTGPRQGVFVREP